jgi:hypothetical protein
VKSPPQLRTSCSSFARNLGLLVPWLTLLRILFGLKIVQNQFNGPLVNIAAGCA